jgi:chromosome segregation ATPase
MSQSTPQEQIALLNAEKQLNTNKINDLNISISNKQTEINNYTNAIGEFEGQITAYESDITTLESNNSTIDEIIVKITPVK